MGTVFDRAVEVGPLKHNTVRQIAELVKEITGSKSEIVVFQRDLVRRTPGLRERRDARPGGDVRGRTGLPAGRDGEDGRLLQGAAVTLQKLFRNRPDFITIYSPLIGDSMLEFGNKREGDMVYKHTFEVLGSGMCRSI